MDKQEFQKLTLKELESLTGVSRPRWCRWFAGSRMREDSIEKLVKFLDMPEGELLEAVRLRRLIRSGNIEAKSD